MKEVSVKKAEHMADCRDCLKLAGAIADSVESYDSDDLLEVIVPHLQPVLGKLEALEAVAGELAGALEHAEVMLRGAQALAQKTEVLDAVIEQVQSSLSNYKALGISPSERS